MARPELDSHKYCQLIFDKKDNTMKKRESLQKMLLEQLDICMQKKNKKP